MRICGEAAGEHAVKALPDHLPIVGREREIEVLTKHLDDALAGKGSCVLISGEAGIGKTRLIEEMKGIASAKGFTVLSSHCLQEDLTVYGPFKEALESGRLEYLFAEGLPRVDGIYLVTDSGLLAKAVTREKGGLDPDLFASMLATVSQFLKDSLTPKVETSGPDSFRRLEYGDRSILVEQADSVNIVTVTTGRENEFLVEDMRETLDKVRSSYASVLCKWDGDEEHLKGVDTLFDSIFEKYNGVNYGEKDPKTGRNILFENISRGLVRHAGLSPIILCIEDLQWADPSTLALLHYVARNIGECRLLILGSFRPEDLATTDGWSHHLLNVMSKMERENLLKKVMMERLHEGDTVMLLQSLFDGELCRETVAQIQHESEGNPLFVIQFARWLVDEGVLIHSRDGWKMARALQPQDVPDRVRDVINRRLNRLEEDRREVANVASVIGEEFDAELLAGVAKIEATLLAKVLGVLEERHRLLRHDQGRYRFDHVKIKDTLYQGIPAELRRDYHRAIATSMEKSHKLDIEAAAGEIAYHFLSSLEPRKALPHLLRAAKQARSQFANEEAMKFYSDALGVADDVPTKYQILIAMGSLHRTSGRNEESLNHYRQAFSFAGNELEKARALVGCANALHYQGKCQETLKVLHEASDLVVGTNTDEEAMVFTENGHRHYLLGEFELAAKCHESALAIYKAINDEDGVAVCLHNLGNVFHSSGDFDKALSCHEESLTIKERIGHLGGMAASLNSIGNARQARGELNLAMSCFSRGVELAKRAGNSSFLACNFGGLANVQTVIGRFDDAFKNYEKCKAIIDRMGDEVQIARWHNSVGNLFLLRENHQKAAQSFENAIAIEERIGLPDELGESFVGMAELELCAGRIDRAAEFCSRALSASTLVGNKQCMARANRVFGSISREKGIWGDAKRNLRETVHAFERIGDPLNMAISIYELALTHGRAGEREEAHSQMRQAVTIFERLGVSPYLEKARHFNSFGEVNEYQEESRTSR